MTWDWTVVFPVASLGWCSFILFHVIRDHRKWKKKWAEQDRDRAERERGVTEAELKDLAIRFGSFLTTCAAAQTGTANITLTRNHAEHIDKVQFVFDLTNGKHIELECGSGPLLRLKYDRSYFGLLAVAIAFHNLNRDWGYIFDNEEKGFADAAIKELALHGVKIHTYDTTNTEQ